MCSKRCAFVCCTVAVVLLAALALVGIFVVGPAMAQNMMDNTVVTLENSTLIPELGELVNGSWADLYVQSNLHSPGPLGATIVPYRATMSTNGVDFGYFEFPEASVNKGDNSVNFRANFTVTNAEAMANWTVTWLIIDPDAIVNLGVTGVAEARSLGLLFKPKQHVELWCKQLAGGPGSGLSMKCTKEYPSKPSPTGGNGTTSSTKAQPQQDLLVPVAASGAAEHIELV